MKRHNAKAIAAAVAIAAAAPVEGKRKTAPTTAEQVKQNLNASTLYVDVVKNMSKSESSPPATPTPPPPPPSSKFTILHEDFPALPGTPEAHVPDDWTAMISDDDADADDEEDADEKNLQQQQQQLQEQQQHHQLHATTSITPDSISELDAEPSQVPDLLVELQSSSGSSNSCKDNSGSSENAVMTSTTTSTTAPPLETEIMPPAVALVAAITDGKSSNGDPKELSYQPTMYVCHVGNGIFDKQFLAAGVNHRAWSRQNNEVAANANIGPPPGFEHIKFYGRLRTNRMGVPLGGVTFDCALPQPDTRRWSRPQLGRGIDGPYGLVGLAGRLEATQQNPKLLSQLLGHDAAGLNVDAHYCACEANKLYACFAGPLQGGRCAPHEVHHDVPLHYREAGARVLPQPKTNQMEVELLFFFFYTYPGDMMQMLAAAELAERGWRFHIFERLWIRRQSDNPHYKRCGYQESGEYNYFNMVHWRILARHFDLLPQHLERTITKSELSEQYGYHPQMRWVTLHFTLSTYYPSLLTSLLFPSLQQQLLLRSHNRSPGGRGDY